MYRFAALCSLLIVPALLFSSEFRSGQAATAVIGQSSFSVSGGQFTPTALSLAGPKLFVTDKGQRVLSFDVSNLARLWSDRAALSSGACGVCVQNPTSVATQSVISGVSRVSTYANSVAIADPASHHVLIWRDSKSWAAASGPDVVLGSGTQPGTPVAANTIIDPIAVALDAHRLFVGDAALHRVLVWNSLPTSGTQPADVVLGQPDMNSSSDLLPAPGRITRPSTLMSDGRNLFVADPVAHRVLVFTPSDFPLSEKSVLNSATGLHGFLAPGALVTIEGENLASRSETAVDDGERSLPESLGGIEVLLNGRPLPLLAVSPGEIRCQLPYNLGGADSATLAIHDELGGNRAAFSNTVSVEIRSVSPGILAFAGPEPRAGIVVHVSSETGETSSPVTGTEPARPRQPVVIWASGLGEVVDADGLTQPVAGQPYRGESGNVLTAVQVEIDGQPVQLVSANLPRHAIGIYQVEVLLPSDLPPNSLAHLTLLQGDGRSNTVTLPVGNPIQ